MNVRNAYFRNVFVAMLAASLAIGCGQADSEKPKDAKTSTTDSTPHDGEEVDPHDVPLTEAEIEQLRKDNATYAEAIAHIQSYRDTIRDETTDGSPAKAHRSLDNLDLVLEWLPEIAQQSGVPKSNWEEVNTAAQNLRDLFNKVHANIDAGNDPDYPAVADEIDSSVEVIAAIKPSDDQ